jgi:hypothetical protein
MSNFKIIVHIRVKVLSHVLTGDTNKAQTDSVNGTAMFISSAKQVIYHNCIQFQKAFFWSGCSKTFKGVSIIGQIEIH